MPGADTSAKVALICCAQASAQAAMVAAVSEDLNGWSGALAMGAFPQLWSWTGKSTPNSTERWSPLGRICPPRKAPQAMALSRPRWLCKQQHLSDSVAAAFDTRAGHPIMPEQVCCMPIALIMKLRDHGLASRCLECLLFGF